MTKRCKILTILAMIPFALLFHSSIGHTDDFHWMRDFNTRCGADPSGFRARLETRFRVGDLAIKAVLDNAASAADAYAMLWLGEVSRRPIDDVIIKYKEGKGQGWGSIAKNLGIKPGSNEFHRLKNGQCLNSGKGGGKARGKNKHK